MSRRKSARTARADARHTARRTSAGPADVTDRRRLLNAGALLALLSFAAFANSFGAGLVLDSAPIILSDPRVHGWSADTLKLIFTRDYWWPEVASDLYRPLTTLSYWANYTLLGNGADVTGYHVVNFVLHAANTWLVFVVVRRLSRRFALALLTAALFAVHPIHTEAVTNVVGRADLLATLAVLGAGWCYIRATDTAGRTRVRWLVAAGFIACIGVLTKESAVLIGVFVVLYDLLWRWPLIAAPTTSERLRIAAREFVLKGWIAFAPAAGIVYSVREVIGYHTTTFAQAFVVNPIAGADWFTGVMTAWNVVGRSIGLLVFPLTLSSDYSYHQIPLYGEPGARVQDALAWAAIVLVAILIWVAWRLRHRRTIVTWGIAFLLLGLLPTSNILFPIGSILGERFLYLPSVGFCAVAAAALVDIATRLARMRPLPRWPRRRVAWGVSAIVVAAFTARALIRNADWRDHESLWESAVRASPNSFNAHRGYASALLGSGEQTEAQIDRAIASAEQSLAILDNPPLPMEFRENRVLLDLGVYYRLKALRVRTRGDDSLAASYLRRSVAVLERGREVDEWFNRESRAALARRGHHPDSIRDVGLAALYFELGDTRLAMQEWQGARSAARYAQHIAPRAQRGYMIDGVAAFYERRPDEASVAIAAALLVDVTRPDLWNNLAACFQAMGLAPPIVERGGQPTFDMSSPAGQQLLLRAAPLVVQRFREGMWYNEAREWQEKLMRAYALPSTAFTSPPVTSNSQAR